MVIGLFQSSVAGIAAEPGREFSIDDQMVKEDEIVDARAQPDLSGVAAIMITFEAPAAARVDRVLRQNFGKTVTIRLNGTPLAGPVVREALLDGQMLIRGSFSVLQAEQLAKLISGKDPLPDSLDDEH